LLLLFTKARISIVIAFSLAFLSLTQNFKCKTLDGRMVDCSKCGKPISDDELYQCNASKVILYNILLFIHYKLILLNMYCLLFLFLLI